MRLKRVAGAALNNTTAALRAARGDPDPRARIAAAVAATGALLESEFAAAHRDTPARQQAWQKIACKRGCAACCYIPIAVTVVEAITVAAAAARDPTLVAQVQLLAPVLAAAGAVGRWRRRLPCPLLRNNECGVYQDRPLPCRAYLSYDAAKCDRALQTGNLDLQAAVPLVELPREFAAAVRAGIRAACIAEGVQDAHIEMTAAVAAILADPTLVPRWLAGEAVFASPAPRAAATVAAAAAPTG